MWHKIVLFCFMEIAIAKAGATIRTGLPHAHTHAYMHTHTPDNMTLSH